MRQEREHAKSVMILYPRWIQRCLFVDYCFLPRPSEEGKEKQWSDGSPIVPAAHEAVLAAQENR